MENKSNEKQSGLEIKPPIRLSNLFHDHAVLQRGTSVPVWGWTNPLVKVIVTLGPYTAQSLSGSDGKFFVRLPPMKAGGPYELEVSLPDLSEKVVSRDVWVGEVWLASGQSNMEFTFTMLRQDDGQEVKETIPGLRMANVAHYAHAGKRSDTEVSWNVASPDTIPEFSAVAFHFGKVLHKELGIPVGIINSSWGGTIIEAWTSRETLVRNPDVNPWVQRYEANVHSREFWEAFLNEEKESPFPRDPGNKAFHQGWADKDFDDINWEEMKVPGTWTSQGHKYSGIFWFRKSIEVPQSWAGKDLVIGLGAVDKQDITYFNGEQVGATGSGLEENYWNKNREYLIPGHLVKAGKNVIAVRAYSFAFDGGLIGPAQKMFIQYDADKENISLSGKWKYNIEYDFGLITPPKKEPGPGNPNSPYILYDNMIAPLVPYALRGAIWYQGESNADKPQTYLKLMKDLICDWRQVWGQGDFQFIMVQLANYENEDNWPLLREAQWNSLAEPNTGMAVAIDIGNPRDIHPENKLDVGRRLALWVLAGSYGKSIEYSGPLYSSMTIEENKIRIQFSHTGGGLVAKEGPLKTFIIAGDDKTFLSAEAEIEGDTVVVSNCAVLSPIAVRYAWDNNPRGCNLYNKAGLPASPFRTDSW